MSAIKELQEFYEKKAAAGLLDVKFDLRNIQDASVEDIAKDILALERAIQDGKVRRLNFGDLRWKE